MRGGKSEYPQRKSSLGSRQWVTPTGRKARESATETIPPCTAFGVG